MIVVWSPKGGSGTSVVAATLALRLATTSPARIADLAGDQASLLALPREPVYGLGDWLGSDPPSGPDALARLAVEVTPGLSLLPLGTLPPAAASDGAAGARLAAALLDGPPTVVDAGGAATASAVAVAEAAPACLVVVRPCYLALRRAVAHPLTATSTGVVVVDEPGHPLTARDVGEVLRLPVVVRIPYKPQTVRSVDAGTLAVRMPEVLDRAARVVLDRFGPDVAGRAA